jgi:hypothetical protein
MEKKDKVDQEPVSNYILAKLTVSSAQVSEL